jgi:hypothetical protein
MYCLTYKLYVANTKYETGWTMGLPLHLSIKLGTHLMKMKLRGVEKFPMIVEVEPLFA